MRSTASTPLIWIGPKGCHAVESTVAITSMLFFAALVAFFFRILPQDNDARIALGRATLWWATTAIVWTEALSAAHLVGPAALSIPWILVLAWAAWRWRFGDTLSDAIGAVRGMDVERRVVGCLVLLFITCAGVTALVAAPNTWDSLDYHLPRVEHWLQNRSLAHYPTNDFRQVALNPGAEILLLHARALARHDVLLNLVQFTCYLTAIAAASAVASRLGAGSRGQWYAAVYAATVPIVVLQASSTQNDLVTACWVLVAAERVFALRTERRVVPALEAGAALGLALVTKGTGTVFGFPVGCWLVFESWRAGWRRGIRYSAVTAAVILLLNVPWWSRNYAVFHNPLGNIGPIVTNARHGLDVVWSNGVRNLASEALTSSDALNRRLVHVSTRVLERTGVDPEDRATTDGEYRSILAQPGWLRLAHEDLAANPIHTALALLSIVQLMYLAGRRRPESFRAAAFAGTVVAAAAMYCLVLKWQPWATRLHVPLFFLVAPAVGVVIERWRVGPALAAASVMAVAGGPALLFNDTRPLFSGYPPGRVSIWSQPREDVLFVHNPGARKDYEAAADAIARRHPREVGMLLPSGSFEYELWYLLRERGVTPRMTHLHDVVGIAHPVEPAAPDTIIAINLDPSTSADLRRVSRELGCDFRVTGHWDTVVLLERACESNSTRRDGGRESD